MLLCQVLLGIVSGEEVARMTRMNLTQFVYTASSAPNSLYLQVKMSSFLLIRRVPFT